MRNRKWSDLSDGEKRFYRERGVSPQTFNAWWRKSQLERASLTRTARLLGYDSGLEREAALAASKRYTGRRRLLMTRKEAGESIGDRPGGWKVIKQIFQVKGDTPHEVWTNFYSP